MTRYKQWHELRFTPSPAKISTACAECGKPMWLPASKLKDYKRCGPECNRAWHKRELEKRRRNCETCGESFIPRRIQITNGIGRFCSQRCNTTMREASNLPAAIKKRWQTRHRNRALGKEVILRGPMHPSWKGGREAQRERIKPRLAEIQRKYRKRNPDKVREWADSRESRKVGRLPRGTVKRIGEAQRWKCAICRCGIKSHYHVDHIMPLALGGEHTPRNIQLLCPGCNVRKQAKHPINYMQSLGRLL